MVLIYVQTFTVEKGKFEEHDELMKEGMKTVKAVTGQTVGRHFSQRHGPMGARVLIMEYEDYDDFRSFWAKWDNDERTLELRRKFRERIDTASWRAYFWDEIPPE